MIHYIIRRLLQGIIVILGVSVIIFFLLHLAPGDPARMMAGEYAVEEQIELIREELGLNKPLTTQYWIFISNAIRGDLGKSLHFKKDNLEFIMYYLPNTLKLTLAAFAIAITGGLFLGIIAGANKDTYLDLSGMGIAVLGQSTSPVWLGIVMLFIFAVELRLVPAFGMGTWKHYILPSISLGFPQMAMIARLTRAELVEVLNMDYIKTARAKGLTNRVVIIKHGLRNALISVVTFVGLRLGVFLGGAVVTENIFNWPGMGTMLVRAVMSRDYPLVQATILIFSAILVLANLIVDISYAFINPRIQYH
jgi:glutathione transport system permease protein